VKTKDYGVSGGEARETGGGKIEEDFAALQSCLIGGNPEQTGRERKLRRRSLILSTLVQVAVLLAVIAIPFFSKAERITVEGFIPIPPYHSSGNTTREHAASHLPPSGQRRSFCIMCPPARPTNPASLASHDGPVGADEPVIGSTSDEARTACSSCIPIGNGPKGPEIVTQVPSVVRMTHIDPAMLVERIEPTYPALARQTRREGRVELHAIISADGRIEQLEVVSGDVLFYQSALEAVRRWRYRATLLNGQAVKVDTYITVIYTLR
jgi:TonB family protein